MKIKRSLTVKSVNKGPVVKVKQKIDSGLAFGTTSGIITTLGLMIGLTSSTNSKIAVIGGILTIALADGFSDALGMHISQEGSSASIKDTWKATFMTFGSKLIFALTFLIPVLFTRNLLHAAVISVAWGLLVIGVLSFYIARQKKENPWSTICEHLFIAIVVVVVTYFLGEWIAATFI